MLLLARTEIYPIISEVRHHISRFGSLFHGRSFPAVVNSPTFVVCLKALQAGFGGVEKGVRFCGGPMESLDRATAEAEAVGPGSPAAAAPGTGAAAAPAPPPCFLIVHNIGKKNNVRIGHGSAGGRVLGRHCPPGNTGETTVALAAST